MQLQGLFDRQVAVEGLILKDYPMERRTACGSAGRSWPAMETLPFCTGRRVVRMLITVLFPAPLGPRGEDLPLPHEETHAIHGLEAVVAVLQVF